jgi:carbon-monoxide dehydrogenase medium subunit
LFQNHNRENNQYGGREIIMSGSFEYLRPNSPVEACELKSKYKQEAIFWAGGTDLLLEWKRGARAFDYCIDLSYLSDLRYINSENGDTVIGALTTIAALEAHEHYADSLGVLVEVAKQFATPQIRTTATIGGNLCHAVPSADYAVSLLALDAEVKLLNVGGERTLAVEDFFVDVKQTALRTEELLVEIRIPHPPPRSACAFHRVTRTSVDIALVNAAVRLTVDQDERVSDARIALGAVAPVPLRSKAAEMMLVGKVLDEIDGGLLDHVGLRAAEDTRPISDVRTTASYRKHVGGVLVIRALNEAIRKLKV